MSDPLSKFLVSLASINDDDYGDFMRKTNMYLWDLSNELGPNRPSAVDEKLNEMQMYIQFNPKWNFELVRDRLKSDIMNLNDLLTTQTNHAGQEKKMIDFHPQVHP